MTQNISYNNIIVSIFFGSFITERLYYYLYFSKKNNTYNNALLNLNNSKMYPLNISPLNISPLNLNSPISHNYNNSTDINNYVLNTNEDDNLTATSLS